MPRPRGGPGAGWFTVSSGMRKKWLLWSGSPELAGLYPMSEWGQWPGGVWGVDSAGEIRVDFSTEAVRWKRAGMFSRYREKTEFPTPLLTLTTTPIDEP